MQTIIVTIKIEGQLILPPSYIDIAIKATVKLSLAWSDHVRITIYIFNKILLFI